MSVTGSSGSGASFQEEPTKWAQEKGMAAFGAGTPREQVVVSLLLAVVAYVVTFLSAGATFVLIIIFTFTFLWGLARLVYQAAVMGWG